MSLATFSAIAGSRKLVAGAVETEVSLQLAALVVTGRRRRSRQRRLRKHESLISLGTVWKDIVQRNKHAPLLSKTIGTRESFDE